jgi:hypothetical protein
MMAMFGPVYRALCEALLVTLFVLLAFWFYALMSAY